MSCLSPGMDGVLALLCSSSSSAKQNWARKVSVSLAHRLGETGQLRDEYVHV